MEELGSPPPGSAGHSAYGGLAPPGHNAELRPRTTRLHRQVPADGGPGRDAGLLPLQVALPSHSESPTPDGPRPPRSKASACSKHLVPFPELFPEHEPMVSVDLGHLKEKCESCREWLSGSQEHGDREKLKLGSRHRPQAGAEPAFVQEPRLRLGDLLRGWAAAGLLGPGGRGARASG